MKCDSKLWFTLDVVYLVINVLYLECNDTFLNSFAGSVTSPLYHNYYENSLRCEILIEAPENYTIMLTFPWFNTETGDSLQVGVPLS